MKPWISEPEKRRTENSLRTNVEATPARIAQGRVGTRYPTSVYLGLRAEHAVARDAVASELPAGFEQRLSAVGLTTRAKDKQEYLLQPNLGRRLSDASRSILLAQGTPGVDVQLIFADGLASWAIERQGERLLPALQAALSAVGLRTGTPLVVRFARIGVQDEIGVLTRSACTLIALGERPGLGTGDSLSIYTAFGPKLDQDNAEKNCISNIRPLGLSIEAAAATCAQLLAQTFAAGKGGVHLVSPLRTLPARASTGNSRG